MRNSKLFKLSLIFAALICSFVAFYFGFRIGKKVDPRAPAALPKTFDYSVLPESELKLAASEHLVTGLKPYILGTAMGMTLGHFNIRDKSGKNFTACQKYQKVELTFHAGDMAVSGDPPTMILNSDCVPDYEIDKISPLTVEYDKVLRLKVADTLVSTYQNNTTTARFDNVSDEWPRTWVLRKIRLYTPDGDELAVSDAEIRRIHGKAVTMEWPR